MHTKFGGDWTHSSGDMLADRQTDRQTDRHSRQTRSSQNLVPYRGGVNNLQETALFWNSKHAAEWSRIQDAEYTEWSMWYIQLFIPRPLKRIFSQQPSTLPSGKLQRLRFTWFMWLTALYKCFTYLLLPVIATRVRELWYVVRADSSAGDLRTQHLPQHHVQLSRLVAIKLEVRLGGDVHSVNSPPWRRTIVT